MIGVFDSGVGGLSVLREIRALLPEADLLYLADRSRAPYGPRPRAEVRRFSREVTERLLAEGAGMVVIACNAASTASLHHLRSVFPQVPFVGMEPAVKPAVAATRAGVIGVLTTSVTSQGELFASVVDRFARDIEVVTQVCHGWVETVELGRVEGPEVDRLVARHVKPVLDAGADTLVLACTHYPFLAPVIRRVAGGDVAVLDPAPAVALQAARVARQVGASGGGGALRLLVSGQPEGVGDLVRLLVGLESDPQPITWPTA